jgi:hypothetical protein
MGIPGMKAYLIANKGYRAWFLYKYVYKNLFN